MKITVVGSGTVVPRLERRQSCVVVRAGGQMLVFDLGSGAFRGMLRPLAFACQHFSLLARVSGRWRRGLQVGALGHQVRVLIFGVPNAFLLAAFRTPMRVRRCRAGRRR